MSELLSVQDFSSKIKEKYPEYKDVDDLELTNKIIEKYPEYKDKVNLNVTNEPSAGEVVGGLAAEVALAEGMKYAGAAGGATLGSVVPVLGTAVGGTIGYTVGAISGGITGSIAAQKIEGREDISWGRVIGDTLLNFIPASKVFKGGSTAVRVAKTAGTQAAAGAAIAPTSQAIESYVDTGEIPDVNELAGSSLRGAALGAGLGATSVGVGKLFGKLKGKKITDVDTMVATGDLDASDFKNATKGNSKLIEREVNNSANAKASEIMAKEALVIDDVTKANIDQANEIAAKSKGSISKLYASLVPSKVIGRESNQAAIDFKRSVVEYKEIGSRIAENVKRNIRGDKELNDQLNRLLDGEPVTMTLDMHKKFGADIRKYQEVKLDLQHKMLSLIDEGAYKSLNDEARERLQDTIQDSIAGNSYNRREYKLFLDKNFKQDPKLKEAAFNELAAKMGAKKAKEHMDKLENASAATKAADVREFYGSAVDSIMKRRHEVGAAERAWLGEVTDAPERIRGTLEGVGKSVARAETDLRIQQSLVKAGLAAQEKGEGMVSLRLRGTGPNGTGLYVNPEVQVALNQVYLPNVDKGMNNIVLDGMVDFYRSNVALSKASKVLLNTISYPVQVYGNMTFLAGMAINPFKGSKRAAQLALAEFGTIERLTKDPTARKALLDDIQEMSKYGIKGSNIIDSDIRSTLENGVFTKWLQEGVKIKGKQVTPSLNFFGKAYSVPDTMGRYIGWKANQSKFRKIFPNASDEAIKKYAAISINDTYPNYDKLSNVIKTTSKWGVIPQFASFTMEFSRNQYNQGKTIAKMLSGKFGEEARQELGEANYAEMAKEGSRRLAALSAVYAGTYGLVEGVKAYAGIDKEKDDALRNLAYSPWDKNKQMMVHYNPKTRKGWTADPSYVVPHAIGMSAFQAGLNGEDEASLMSFVFEQVIGEGSFVMQSAFRALTNTNKSGKEITNEIDKLKAGSDKLKFYLTDAFKTGAQKEYEKFTMASEGRGDLTLQQVFQRQVGIRKNSFDLNESAMFSVMNNYNHGKNAAAKYYSALKYKDLSKEQYQAEYEIANRINKESFNELLKNNEAMAALGYTEEERINIMRDAKVSSEVVLSVLGGKYVDLPIAKEKSTGETYDELTGTDQEKIKQIGKLRSTDPTLAKKLMNKHRSEIRMKRKGINVKDELIKNLDTIQKVNYFKNNRGLIPEYRKKGIISNEVLRALETTQ
jgi:hypothetical protein